MKAAYISHASSVRHEMGEGHPECPERVAVIADRLLMKGLLDAMSTRAPRVASDIAARAGLSIAEVQALLGQLELTGAVGERERGWLKVDRKAE